MSEPNDWPSDGTCRQCGAAPRHPLNGLCATCEDEWPCTDCEGTGITIQTERPCACQSTPSLNAEIAGMGNSNG